MSYTADELNSLTPLQPGHLAKFKRMRAPHKDNDYTVALIDFSRALLGARGVHPGHDLNSDLEYGDVGLVMATLHHSTVWADRHYFALERETLPSCYIVRWFSLGYATLVFGTEIEEAK